MRRLLLFLSVLLTLAGPVSCRAAVHAEADCNPLQALLFQDAVPSLRLVAPDAGRVHFVKSGVARPGCPSAAPACRERGFVLPGDAVIVVGTGSGYACAIFASPAPRAATTSGWLPEAALATPAVVSDATPLATPDWRGDWRSGAERRIRIDATPQGGIALAGEATFGAGDPDRVRRGAVNTGDFDATATPLGDQLAFLVGDDGKALPFDAARAKAESLCGLRLWRLGPSLVATDNLQCGGMNVTFTGVYRRIGQPR